VRCSNRWPIGPWEYVDRRQLRRAALRYAAHGWAVTSLPDFSQVTPWWRRRPYTVLLATGAAFDALEVPAAAGLRVLGAVRLHTGVLGATLGDGRGPVVVTPSGRWLFLVRPGAALRPELESDRDVRRHGPGSWIPAAPGRTPQGPVRWAVSPDQAGWQLPESATVQAMLLDALHALGRRPQRAATASVPRQISTARRAL
jgi:hypothetical protein